jgi:2'-5' RNA ligase
MSTYDIFLVPEATQYKMYAKIIESFSKRYKTPSFPHITLLGMLEGEEQELLSKTDKIVKPFKSMEVGIFGMNFTNTVNQCVFAQIKMSSELLTLYNELATNLHYSRKAPFFPHMSLVYGDLSTEEKSNIASQTKVGKTLILDRLLIYRDGPLASDWAQVAEFKL